MFRSDPELPLFGYIPVRLIVPILLILAAVVAVVLFLGIEHEQAVIKDLTGDSNSAGSRQSRAYLFQIAVLLVVFASVSISALLTYQSYQATRQTLERVKGLARNILESIPIGVMTVDHRGRITAINPVAEQILRTTAETALGRVAGDFTDDRDPIYGFLKQAIERRAFVQNVDIRSRGDPDQWIRLTTADLADQNRPGAGVVILLLNVTELLRLEDQLRRSEKLSALHTLSAGIAHEIRNPLSAVDLNLHLLQEELGIAHADTPAVERYLEIVNAEVGRLRDIVDGFLRFAKPGSPRLEEVRLPAVVDHIVSLVRYEAHERGITMTADLAPDLPLILGDETQLGQLLLNLLINGIQAMPDGGQLVISGRLTQPQNGSMVEITVSDTGVGIATPHLGKVFEPFFSTKSGGTGLGLAIAYRIVEDHRGTIQVRSEEGVGTTFRLSFPSIQLRSIPLSPTCNV
jgi:PAS domain S-box-containing protein